VSQEPPAIVDIKVTSEDKIMTLHLKSLVGPFKSGVEESVNEQLPELSQTAITTPTLDSKDPLPELTI